MNNDKALLLHYSSKAFPEPNDHDAFAHVVLEQGWSRGLFAKEETEAEEYFLAISSAKSIQCGLDATTTWKIISETLIECQGKSATASGAVDACVDVIARCMCRDMDPAHRPLVLGELWKLSLNFIENDHYEMMFSLQGSLFKEQLNPKHLNVFAYWRELQRAATIVVPEKAQAFIHWDKQ